MGCRRNHCGSRSESFNADPRESQRNTRPSMVTNSRLRTLTLMPRCTAISGATLTDFRPGAIAASHRAGWNKTDAGVKLLIAAADRDDPRPIWYGNWGSNSGADSNLRRAFDRVKNRAFGRRVRGLREEISNLHARRCRSYETRTRGSHRVAHRNRLSRHRRPLVPSFPPVDRAGRRLRRPS